MATILVDDHNRPADDQKSTSVDGNHAVEAPVADNGIAQRERETQTRAQADVFSLLAQAPARGGAGLRIFQTIPSALAALRANKGRSVLTTLGIIIGVAAVIAIVALGEGASASVSNQLAGLGVNLLTITPGSTRSGGAAAGAG
ncbi:MAG TPA: ABC transporter permease, partial [Chloroflexota bacterium]